jgi:hypothetical protein
MPSAAFNTDDRSSGFYSVERQTDVLNGFIKCQYYEKDTTQEQYNALQNAAFMFLSVVPWEAHCLLRMKHESW